ncbi:MAG: PAC2 family protein [Candidatus Micrarchaeia archaeon]
MKDISIFINKKIKPVNPILIAGLPGIGNVGKIAVDYIRKELKAERYATIYSKYFPQYVVMLKNGLVRMGSNTIYYVNTHKKIGSDLLLFTGDFQSASTDGQYKINSKIIEFFKNRLSGKFVYTIGGYASGEQAPKQHKVFANATSQKVIEEFKDTGAIFNKTSGTIIGSAGMLIGFAKLNKMNGICLMGETGFNTTYDMEAAEKVISLLSKKIKIKIDTTELKERAKQYQSQIDALAGISEESLEEQVPQYPAYPENMPKPSYIR